MKLVVDNFGSMDTLLSLNVRKSHILWSILFHEMLYLFPIIKYAMLIVLLLGFFGGGGWGYYLFIYTFVYVFVVVLHNDVIHFTVPWLRRYAQTWISNKNINGVLLPCMLFLMYEFFFFLILF